jgi:hypothetical protein
MKNKDLSIKVFSELDTNHPSKVGVHPLKLGFHSFTFWACLSISFLFYTDPISTIVGRKSDSWIAHHADIREVYYKRKLYHALTTFLLSNINPLPGNHEFWPGEFLSSSQTEFVKATLSIRKKVCSSCTQHLVGSEDTCCRHYQETEVHKLQSVPLSERAGRQFTLANSESQYMEFAIL